METYICALCFKEHPLDELCQHKLIEFYEDNSIRKRVMKK